MLNNSSVEESEHVTASSVSSRSASARLDHFTLRTRHLAQTTAFFKDVFGFTVGARPAFPFAGAWLYNDGAPVVHLADAGETGDEGLSGYLGATGDLHGKGALDHVAFRCSNYPEFRKRIDAAGLTVRERIIPELGELQVFVDEPNGVSVELVFAAEENARGDIAVGV